MHNTARSSRLLRIGTGIVFILVLTPLILLIPYAQKDRICNSDWVTTDVEGLVIDALRKQGGLPPVDDMLYVHSDIRYVEGDGNEVILGWRIRENSQHIWIDPLSHNDHENHYGASVEVLYADGGWRSLNWRHRILGYVSFCQLPPLTTSKFSAPVSYKTDQTNAEFRPIMQEIVPFGVNNEWHYSVQSIPGEAWRIISIQINSAISKDTLAAFADYNQTVGQRVSTTHEQLTVQIIFDTPVSQAVLKEVFRAHHLTHATVYVKTLNKDGDPTVWPIKTDDNPSQVKKQLQYNERMDGLYTETDPAILAFIGVTNIVGQIPASTYDKLVARDDVFLVDVTPTLVQDAIFEQTGIPVSDADMLGAIPVVQQRINIQIP